MTRKSYGCSRPGCHKSRHYNDNNVNKNCCCVEGLAEQLEDNEGEFVIVFEKNAIVIGRIDEVRDDQVLVLEDVLLKVAFFDDRRVRVTPGVNPTITFDAFISICKITEFLVIIAQNPRAAAQTIANNISNQL
ncbi:hypothetical protein ACIQ34_15525 [Ureibacillus sp. NPDC094379]